MAEQENWARHLDHELSQLLFLHAEFRAERFREYPEEVQRACDVAYAAHLRVVLEFMHSGRPSPSDKEQAGCEPPDDPHPGDFPQLQGLFTAKWTTAEVRRTCDADKLLAHLSKTRDALSSAPGWGAESDRVLWDDGVRQIIHALGTTLLPNASAKIG